MSPEHPHTPSLLVEIHVLQDGEVVHTEPLAQRALFMGRGPDNDLVLADRMVSGRHAVFHLAGNGTQLMLRDLGSTNGTFVNDKRVGRPVRLDDGDAVRLGSNVTLRVQLSRSELPSAPLPTPSLLVDLNTGIAHPVRSDRIFVGEGEHCELRIPGDAELACITLHDNGEIWLSTDDAEHPITAGEPFEIADRTLVFRFPTGTLAATARDPVERTTYGYQLEVSLQAETGPEAWIFDPRTDRRYAVTAENRVSLLWVLAKKLQDDQEEGLAPDAAGWCVDEEVMRGIWGRSWQQMGSNNYQVLLSRTRKELRKAGFDGWFIEKRRGHTRLRLQTVKLA